MMAAKVISGESNKGAGGGIVEGAESKTLAENPRNKGVSSEGVRVSEDSVVLGVESVTKNAGGNEAIGSGRLIIKDKYAALSKNRIVEVRSQNSRWDSWGVMNMVGRVLGGKFSVDDEVEDSKTSEIRREANVVVDKDMLKGVVREPTSVARREIEEIVVKKEGVSASEIGREADVVVDTSANKTDIERIVSDELVLNDLDEEASLNKKIDCDVLNGAKNSNDLVEDTGLNGGKDLDGLVEGSGLKEAHDSISNELMETEKVNAVEYGTYLVPKPRGEHQITENVGEYYVSDLVWGKVKSHPWWPGQIFPPIAASDEAAKHIRKQSYLIAYFGDRSFAWNEVSNIRHFRTNFSEMEKQSDSEGFCRGVSCALDEVARRVEFGLLCNCVNQEVHNEVKLQVVSNDGVWEGNSVNEGGDSLSMAPSFLPGSVVQFLESAAGCPKSETNKLEFTIVKAQLLAFNRWKGRYELPVFEQRFGLLEENASQVTEEDGLSSRKRSLTALDGCSPSTKRRNVLGDMEFPRLKEKHISSLMSVSPCVVEEPLKKARRTRTRRGRPVSSGKNSNSVDSNSNESELVEITPTEIPAPDVILSRVILSAKVPTRGLSVMISDIDFLRQFRNLICLEKTCESGIGGLYWTDRIIQDYSEEALLEPKNGVQESGESEPTALIMNFTNLDCIPSVPNLNEMFGRYGPLKETETKILSERKRVKVVFKRRADAEAAFSSSWKYSIFGTSIDSFRLHYDPTHSSEDD